MQMTMASDKKEKETKEIYRLTMACDACRVRKRKCDGKSPCSYCTAKNQPCEFSTRKKRGPKRSHDQMKGSEEGTLVSIGSSSIEAGALDRMEAYNYFNYCWQFAHRLHALSSKNTILNPVTVPQKIQAYSALAYTARLCGDRVRAKLYIDQARTLSGAVYDSPNTETVSAMAMLGIYWLLVLDIPRSKYYANLAYQLVKMAPSSIQDQRLKVFCQLNTVVADEELTSLEKSERLRGIATVLSQLNTAFLASFKIFLDFNAAISETLGLNLMFPTPAIVAHPFSFLDDVHISEPDREMLMDLYKSLIDMVTTKAQDSYQDPDGKTECGGDHADGNKKDHFLFIAKVFGPLIECIINWRSGHIVEALESAFRCIVGLEDTMSNTTIRYSGARLEVLLAHFPQLCLVGNMAKFLMEQGYVPLAAQVCDKLRAICSVMRPDFDFLIQQIDDMVPPALNSSSSSTIAHISSSIPTLPLPLFPLLTSVSSPELSPPPISNYFMELNGFLGTPRARIVEEEEGEEGGEDDVQWIGEGGGEGLSAGEMSVIEGILNSTDATLDLPFIELGPPIVNFS